MKHTWHYPIELLHLYYWWNRSLIIMILKLDRSLSVSEDSNVWTVSVRFAPTRPSVENRKNQQIRLHIPKIPRSQLKLLTVTQHGAVILLSKTLWHCCSVILSYSCPNLNIYFNVHVLYTSRYSNHVLYKLYKLKKNWILFGKSIHVSNNQIFITWTLIFQIQ